MRRRRGGGAAPAEACGVWLDTAELKRGPARPLTLRAATRAAGRKPSLVLLPQPGSTESISPRQGSVSWQSSILSFFSPQPDQRDKENRRPAARREEPRVKILPLPQLEGAQGEPPGAGQGLQGPARAAQTPPEPRVGSQGLGRASPGAGGHSRGWGRDKPRVSPAGTAPGARRAVPCPRAGAGGTNAAPGAAPSRVCCSPQSLGPAQPLRERGQVPAGPRRESQECQGRDTEHRDRDRDTAHRDTAHRDRDRDRDRDTAHSDRDTAHRDRDSPRATPSPRQLLCQGSRVTAHRDRDSPSPPRVTPRPLGATPSPTWTIPSPPRTTLSPPQPPELGSEPLFTQDSEGNRVIKHW